MTCSSADKLQVFPAPALVDWGDSFSGLKRVSSEHVVSVYPLSALCVDHCWPQLLGVACQHVPGLSDFAKGATDSFTWDSEQAHVGPCETEPEGL